jgi:hypothetical protein
MSAPITRLRRPAQRAPRCRNVREGTCHGLPVYRLSYSGGESPDDVMAFCDKHGALAIIQAATFALYGSRKLVIERFNGGVP